jgi:hypothetical protein
MAIKEEYQTPQPKDPEKAIEPIVEVKEETKPTIEEPVVEQVKIEPVI